MKIIVIPKIIIRHKNQIEFAVESKLIKFLKNCFKNCLIDISCNFEFKKKYNLVILSGGNSILKFSKKKNDIYRSKFDEYFFKKAIQTRTPMIGICHGGHFIAMKNKLKLTKDASHVGSHKLKNLSKINIKFNFVNSYHNFKINFSKSKYIQKLFLANDESIECFKVRNKKIGGVIWHPERETKGIKKQINFFKSFYSYIK